MSGPDASRPYIEAAGGDGAAGTEGARPDHPSLLDPTHRLDALLGVVNVPAVTWIDEDGVIVRPPEPGWPGVRTAGPKDVAAEIGPVSRAPGAPEPAAHHVDARSTLTSGQDRLSYPDAVRAWARQGVASHYALTPDEVVARSTPRPREVSEAAAHFELAEHLWRVGERERAIAHFNACHRLQPDNWTYKRQAWSLVGAERAGAGATYGRFVQGPRPGEEGDWPFASDFSSDLARLGEGEYYPKTL